MSTRVLVTQGPQFEADMAEPEDFVVLMGDECGEGSIDWSAEFDDQSNLYKADLLKDWIDELTEAYANILEEGIIKSPPVTH